jgi:hypothetical protein
MKWVKWISGLGVLIMTAGIANALFNGNFSQEGSLILQSAWGQVSMVDLYTGFILFSIWIAFREISWWKAAIWIFLMLTLGFFTGAMYMLVAAMKSGNDWRKFWMGSRA